jgi:hypothetical protein
LIFFFDFFKNNIFGVVFSLTVKPLFANFEAKPHRLAQKRITFLCKHVLELNLATINGVALIKLLKSLHSIVQQCRDSTVSLLWVKNTASTVKLAIELPLYLAPSWDDLASRCVEISD